jgi:hypothetical protein
MAQHKTVYENTMSLVLEVKQMYYSPSEIARIIENNNCVILGLFTKENIETGMLEITIKINKTEAPSLIATFENFNYTILNVYNCKEYTDDLQDRYDMLMNYLNV